MAAYAGAPVIGIVGGVLQGLILLRRDRALAGRWMIASAASGVACSVVIFASSMHRLVTVGTGGEGYCSPCINPLVDGLLAGTMIGLGLGIGQWLVLRRGFNRAEWWIPASLAAWIVGFVVLALNAFPAALMLPGGITGIALEKLRSADR